MSQSSDLRTRLASATEGSRELSDEMLLAAGWNFQYGWWEPPTGPRQFRTMQSDPTRSLSDIVSMIEAAGMRWGVEKELAGAPPTGLYTAFVEDHNAGATTAELALCSSFLAAKLRAQMEMMP